MDSIEVNICNQALSHLGRSSITDLDDSSDKNARACSQAYKQALCCALGDHPWGFAKAEIPLSPAGGKPYPRYDYAYQYPKDCLKPIKILNPLGKKAKKIEYDIQIDHTRTSKVILTNESAAILSYIVYTENLTLADPWFVEMFIYALAMRICMKLTGDKNQWQLMSQAYKEAKAKAQAESGNASYEEPYFYNDMVEDRK